MAVRRRVALKSRSRRLRIMKKHRQPLTRPIRIGWLTRTGQWWIPLRSSTVSIVSSAGRTRSLVHSNSLKIACKRWKRLILVTIKLCRNRCDRTLAFPQLIRRTTSWRKPALKIPRSTLRKRWAKYSNSMTVVRTCMIQACICTKWIQTRTMRWLSRHKMWIKRLVKGMRRKGSLSSAGEASTNRRPQSPWLIHLLKSANRLSALSKNQPDLASSKQSCSTRPAQRWAWIRFSATVTSISLASSESISTWPKRASLPTMLGKTPKMSTWMCKWMTLKRSR